MSAAALRVSPVSGDFLLQLAIAGAGLLAAWWLVNKASGAASSAFDSIKSLPGTLYDTVKEYGSAAADAVGDAAAELAAPVVNAAKSIAAASPGAGLPAGWYTVKTWQGPIVTQYPDRFKSLNRWDSVLVDP